MSDNTETVGTFTDGDGRLIEIDHLGIADPDNRGEFAIYHGDKQIGEFMLPWAMEYADIKAGRRLPADAELIAQAKLALAGDPRVLTQSDAAPLFTSALGPNDRHCLACGCTDSAACDTITGPCAWQTTYDDNTGTCTACSRPSSLE